MTGGPPAESVSCMSRQRDTLPHRNRPSLKWVAAIVLAVGVALVGTRGALGRGREERPLPVHPAVTVAAEPMVAGALVRHGPSKARPSAAARRAPFSRARDGVPIPVELTAYCLRGTTRRGRWVRSGIVATDPRVFPLSRFVEIFVGDRYLGRFLVDDTGRLIKDNKIDVWLPTCGEATVFGRVQGTAVLVPR